MIKKYGFSPGTLHFIGVDDEDLKDELREIAQNGFGAVGSYDTIIGVQDLEDNK